MNVLGWLLAFFYLASVAGWVTTAIREDDGPSPADVQAAPTSEAHHELRRALGFAATVVSGTAVFAVVILLIEWLV